MPQAVRIKKYLPSLVEKCYCKLGKAVEKKKFVMWDVLNLSPAA